MAHHKLISDITELDMQGWFSNNKTVGTQGLLSFCEAIKKKLRGCEFAPKDSRSAWVYMPDQIYALGWVGYGDYRESAKEEIASYTVYSRNIINDMYCDNSFQYYTRGSVNMNVALRHASRYLTRYSPLEIAKELRNPFRQGAKDIEHDANSALRKQEKALFDRRHNEFNERMCRVAVELKVLLSTGYEFTDPALGEELRDYFGKEEEHHTLARQHNAYCVVIDTFLGKQRYQVVSVDSAGSWRPTIHDDVSVYDDESVPGDLAGKLSVLSMCNVDQYVTDVGVRVNEKVFYVAR